VTHEELQELIPLYALDALAPDEATGVEAHLHTCERCQRELVVLRNVAALLAAGVAQVPPPPELRRQIIDSVRPSHPKATRLPGWAPALAAGAVLILLLTSLSLFLEQRLVALERRVEEQTKMLVLLASPSVKTITLTGSVPGNVRLVYDPSTRRGAVVVAGLLDPGRERVYQLWLVAGKKPESAGVFRPEPSRPVIVTVGADFNRYQAIAISIERAPAGAPNPTTTPVLVGTLSVTT
jgi:anti-sigma-K factor RskA